MGIGKIDKVQWKPWRQPEISSKIQTAMIIVAALIEGAGLFALVLTWLLG